jgi:hypothetical protein
MDDDDSDDEDADDEDADDMDDDDDEDADDMDDDDEEDDEEECDPDFEDCDDEFDEDFVAPGEDCYMECHEREMSAMYSLDFVYMRKCFDSCSDETACFMEWEYDFTPYYESCVDFYYWYGDYFHGMNGTDEYDDDNSTDYDDYDNSTDYDD